MIKELVSVNILTYNGENLIGPCLKAVGEQTYPAIEVLVIDNASIDKSVERSQEIKIKFPLRIIKNSHNVGFAAGHNQGIGESRGEYVLCLNQDVLLKKDFVENLVRAMKNDERIGAIQGKLYKINDFNHVKEEIIDSAGLLIYKNGRVINRGQGEREVNQYNQKEEIFGADGAAPLYRRIALEDAKIEDEYFDKDFFCYKEDIDLSWRMRILGWKIFYEPNAVGYHLRGAGELATNNPLKIIGQREKISSFAKFHSFKNQRLMQIKNEFLSLFFLHFFYILIKELGAWLYALIFESYTRKAILELIKQIPRAVNKRREIMARCRIKSTELIRWFK